eukprot:5761502-Amphidinium_carterae.1
MMSAIQSRTHSPEFIDKRTGNGNNSRQSLLVCVGISSICNRLKESASMRGPNSQRLIPLTSDAVRPWDDNKDLTLELSLGVVHVVFLNAGSALSLQLTPMPASAQPWVCWTSRSQWGWPFLTGAPTPAGPDP